MSFSSGITLKCLPDCKIFFILTIQEPASKDFEAGRLFSICIYSKSITQMNI